MSQSGVDMDASNFATTWTMNNPPYVILKWSIENFGSAQNLLTSPCFDVSPTSKWNLVLDPNVTRNEDTFVVFYLKKSHNCRQSGKLLIKGEFSIHGPLNELIFDKLFEEVYDSASNGSIDFRVAKICFSLTASGSDISDTYLVRCEMIMSEEMDSSNEWRPHLEKLSSDFQKLYAESKIPDTRIRASDDIINAHKAMLSARSLALSKRIDSCSSLISEDEKNSLLGAVLLFIYTGNPDLLLASIPLELFGKVALIAARWELNELENILTPVKMHCKTRIRYEEFLYTWQLKNFSKLPSDSRGCIHSAEFRTTEGAETRWKLILEKIPQQTTESYGLYLVKLQGDNASHKVDVQFRMYNRKSKAAVTKRREYTFGPRSGQKCGFSAFADKGCLQSKILKNDILYIDCRLKFRLDTESWIHFQAKFIDVSEEDPFSLKYLKTLSRNFKDIFESKKYSDLTLSSKDGNVQVHRAILCARSPYFSAKLSDDSQQYLIVPMDFSTLREALLYIYSAELPSLNSRNSLKLYKACRFLQIMELWQFCRQYILRNLNVAIVLEVLVIAYEYSDTELENASIDFASIRGNAKMIINTDRWRNFRTNYSNLAMRIYHILAWEYCNHVCLR